MKKPESIIVDQIADIFALSAAVYTSWPAVIFRPLTTMPKKSIRPLSMITHSEFLNLFDRRRSIIIG
jgi:hypothetical protein